MEWNEKILKYAKTNPSAIVYGGTYQDSEEDHRSMIVPGTYGSILFQMEIKAAYRDTTVKECAMLPIRLNQKYELYIKHSNLLKRGWDAVAKAYVHFEDQEFMKQYAVRTNHPEYTKLALGDLAWMDLMKSEKNLTIHVCPISEGALDHTIKVYYAENLLSDSSNKRDTVELMIRCINATYYALSRYQIEDPEVDPYERYN